MTAPVLRFERVSVGRRLCDVTLAVAAGQVHALLGANGSGKTTLLRTVVGGEAFTGLVERAPGPLGYVPQRFSNESPWSLTTFEFLALARTRWPVALGVPKEATRRIDRALSAAQVLGVRDRPLSSLSGGELRRVLLANALEPTPSVALLDEPETGLDAAGLEWLTSVLQELKAAGAGVLWVSHDAERVGRLADAVTRLEAGRVLGG